MSDEPQNAPAAVSPAPITFAQFLQHTPPSQEVFVQPVHYTLASSPQTFLATPDLKLHCAHETCSGERVFRYAGDKIPLKVKSKNFRFVSYTCSNCMETVKTFSINIAIDIGNRGYCYKFGEFPTFGAPVPSRLLRLFGKDSEIFLKGRRCENQGLGIGAFTYYRRVVESHKNAILERILRVAKMGKAPPEMIGRLQSAINEIQFSKAMGLVKDSMPSSLLINGQNPLMLLHSALSVGVHDLTDECCLDRAHDIRLVLVELAERIGQALKDEVELNDAVKRLARSIDK